MACCTHDTHRFITSTSSGDPIRRLEQAGWTLDRVKGSHHVLVHPHHPGIVVIPHPRKDLGVGRVAAILRQASLWNN